MEIVEKVRESQMKVKNIDELRGGETLKGEKDKAPSGNLESIIFHLSVPRDFQVTDVVILQEASGVVTMAVTGAEGETIDQ